MEYVLETKALGKRYQNFTAMNGLNMHSPKGAIMASSEETAQEKPPSSA